MAKSIRQELEGKGYESSLYTKKELPLAYHNFGANLLMGNYEDVLVYDAKDAFEGEMKIPADDDLRLFMALPSEDFLSERAEGGIVLCSKPREVTLRYKDSGELETTLIQFDRRNS